jgi:hypothetical protein
MGRTHRRLKAFGYGRITLGVDVEDALTLAEGTEV